MKDSYQELIDKLREFDKRIIIHQHTFTVPTKNSYFIPRTLPGGSAMAYTPLITAEYYKKMPIVFMIIGLPGSGKSHLIEKEFAKGTPKDTLYNFGLIVDDPTDLTKISQAIEGERNIVIADPNLCNPDIREKAVQMFKEAGYNIKYRYFENNQEKCKRNIAHRNDGRNIKNLDYFNYQIPKDAGVETIWQPNN